MIDYIVIGILVVIIAAAALYVYKAKKSGKKSVSYTHLTLPTNREV